MNELKLIREEYNDEIKYTTILSYGFKYSEEIYIKMPISEKYYMTNKFDPFLIINIFRLMLLGGDWHIRGEVSKSLLDNLENFCAMWNILKPDIYKPINIIADKEFDDSNVKLNDDAIMCFSGGLDSCFTAYSHVKKLAGRNTKNIKKAIMLYGADIPLGSKEQFDIAFNNSKIMLDDLNIELIPIETNYRLLKNNWGFEHIAPLVGIMNLYMENCSNVLVSSTSQFHAKDYDGNNSITNKFLSSNGFNIMTYGENFSRIEKANAIRNWDLGLKYIRVCWEGEDKSKNCCVCEKCQRTILNFKACGVNNATAFDNFKVDLKNIILHDETKIEFFDEILDYNKKYNYLDKETVDNINELISRSRNIIYNNDKVDNNSINIYKEIEDLNKKINKVIDTLAWWIPIRKWRDNFRNKFFDNFIERGGVNNGFKFLYPLNLRLGLNY